MLEISSLVMYTKEATTNLPRMESICWGTKGSHSQSDIQLFGRGEAQAKPKPSSSTMDD